MNYEQLLSDIRAVIKPNNEGEITGQTMQDVLVRIVEDLASCGTYGGVIGTSTVPDTDKPHTFYLLGEVGTYPNLGGIEHNGGIGIAIWDGSSFDYENLPANAIVDLSNFFYRLDLRNASGTSSEFDYYAQLGFYGIDNVRKGVIILKNKDHSIKVIPDIKHREILLSVNQDVVKGGYYLGKFPTVDDFDRQSAVAGISGDKSNFIIIGDIDGGSNAYIENYPTGTQCVQILHQGTMVSTRIITYTDTTRSAVREVSLWNQLALPSTADIDRINTMLGDLDRRVEDLERK